MASVAGEDFYALLGVGITADGAELRRAWRQMARQYHPDRAGLGSTALFQRLSAAYAVLSDPVARAAYDRRRPRAGRAGAASPSAPTAVKPSTNPSSRPAYRSAPAVMLSRLCGHLNTLLATGAAWIEDDEPGLITLVLRPDEAAHGGMVTIPMWVQVACPHCATRPSTACTRCGGTRAVDELYSAWLAVPPEVKPGEVLTPSAELPGMLRPVRFRVEHAGVTS